MPTSCVQSAGSQFVTFSVKPILEVLASCLTSQHPGKQTSPMSFCSHSEHCTASAAWWGWWTIVVLRIAKACEFVPTWKHLACQNLKAGNIFGTNLFLCLSLTFSAAVRNGFDAVQICPISSLSPFTVVRWCQPVPASVSSLLSIWLQQSMCLSLFIPTSLFCLAPPISFRGWMPRLDLPWVGSVTLW